MQMNVYIPPVGKSDGVMIYRCAGCKRLDNVFIPAGRACSPIECAIEAKY